MAVRGVAAMARLGRSRQGTVRLGAAAMAWFCREWIARLVTARPSRPGLARPGQAWAARPGEAKLGAAGLARRGLGCRAGHGSSRRGSHGVVLQRMDSSARHGPAVKARLGKSWPGLGSAAGGQGAAHRGAGGSARQRVAGQCTAVPARDGAVPMAWLVWARQSRRGPARAARPGMARLVLAGRQGPAGPVTDWRGKAGAAWPAVAWLPGLGTGSPARHRLVRQGRARQGRHGGVTPRRRLICL